MFKPQSHASEAYQAALAKERAENDALMAAEQLLKKHGYLVTFIHDGVGATEALRERWRKAVGDAPCAARTNIGYDPEEVFLIAIRQFHLSP